MTVKYASILVACLLAASMSGSALAQTGSNVGGPNVATARASRHRAHAWLRMDVHRAKPWVGQAIPVTVSAYFRSVEGVTLEGTLQIKSKGVMTSDFAREPRQATELIDGERTLVVTWTGAVTASAPGSLELSAELPVRIRFREATEQVVPEQPDFPDPFADLDMGPFDSSIFARMRAHMQEQMRMFEQPMGRVQESTTTLKANAQPLEALALPTTDQPADFSGAVGQFNVTASLSPAHVHGSDPVTLRIAVDGTGDLDRIQLPGVAPSDSWKTYPPKSTIEAGSAGAHTRQKVFEQVLVPLRDGEVTVPAVSLVAFDPASGRYVTRQSSPLVVSVDGPAGVATRTPAEAAPPSRAVPSVVPALERARGAGRAAFDGPRLLVVGVGASLLTLVALGLYRVLRKRRSDRALLHAMRRAASSGRTDAFLGSAHRLIGERLSKRWSVEPEQITGDEIRQRLGTAGEPLVEALSADEALRFARGNIAQLDLRAFCASIEQSLESA